MIARHGTSVLRIKRDGDEGGAMTEILSQLRDEEFCLLAELEAAAMEFSIPFPPPIPIPIY
jgi:hypothetical protein